MAIDDPAVDWRKLGHPKKINAYEQLVYIFMLSNDKAQGEKAHSRQSSGILALPKLWQDVPVHIFHGAEDPVVVFSVLDLLEVSGSQGHEIDWNCMKLRIVRLWSRPVGSSLL